MSIWTEKSESKYNLTPPGFEPLLLLNKQSSYPLSQLPKNSFEVLFIQHALRHNSILSELYYMFQNDYYYDPVVTSAGQTTIQRSTWLCHYTKLRATAKYFSVLLSPFT